MAIAAPSLRDNNLNVSAGNDTSLKPSADNEESTTGIWNLGTAHAEVNQDEYEKNVDDSNVQPNTNALVNSKIKKSDESDSESDADSSSIISFHEDSSVSSSFSTSGTSDFNAEEERAAKRAQLTEQIVERFNELQTERAQLIFESLMQKSARNNAACGPGKALSYCMGPTLILGGVGAMAFTIYTIVRELEYGGKISPASAGLHSFMAIAGAMFAIAGSLCTYGSCKN